MDNNNAKLKKKWYKRWWAIFIYILVFLYIMGRIGGTSEPQEQHAQDLETNVQEQVNVEVSKNEEEPQAQQDQVKEQGNNQQENNIPKKTDVGFTTSEEKLKVVIDESTGTQALDVYYALGRLTDLAILKYPFYAIKNPKGTGYIGIVSGIKSPSGNLDGMAMFLVQPKALNQFKPEIESSIQAINGLAKNFNQNIQYANGYDYLEVKDWLENKTDTPPIMSQMSH